MMRNKYILCFFILVGRIALAQDAHWSQPSNTLLYLNPAFTSAESRYSAGLNFRDQWRAADKTYRTFMLAADYLVLNSRAAHVGIGLISLKDETADKKYSTALGGLTASCLVRTGKNSRLGLGFGFNFASVSYAYENFSWSSQFWNGSYHPDSESGERYYGFDPVRYFDLNTGLAFVYDQSENAQYADNHLKWIAGYSFNHFFSPILSAFRTHYLVVKHTLFIKGSVPLEERLTLQPLALISTQGAANEMLVGMTVRYTLGETPVITANKMGTGISLGIVYRYKDAIAPVLQVDRGPVAAGISYDINVSGFSTVSKFRGGVELSLRFRPARDKPALRTTAN